MDNIYFDYASTTPVDAAVCAAMTPYFIKDFGNAASPHIFGQRTNKALEDARITVAQQIGAQSSEIVFTSGATESNNYAVFGVTRAQKNKGKHIIVSRIEHHSILEPIEYLANNEGYKITFVDVDEEGLIDPLAVKEAITDETVLVAVMHANNEIGTIQPVAEIGVITREHNVPFLADAVQTVGHIPVNVDELQVDLLSLSAHKFYGPKGVGALYVRKGTPIEPVLLGGGQEQGRRASTQNIPGIVGLAKALEICAQQLTDEMALQTQLRDKILQGVTERVKGTRINGHLTRRLPNNAHFSFDQVQGESLLMSLDMAGISASMGSACASGAMEPSHVLRALGLSEESAYGALRITIGRWTTAEQVEYFLEHISPIISQLRV